MTTPLILSVFTCLVYAAFGLAAWRVILKNYNSQKHKFFAWSMFFSSLVVGFMGLRTLLFGLGFIIWDITFAFVDQLCLIFFFIFCGSYAVVSVISKEKLAKIAINFIIIPLSMLFFILLANFVFGIVVKAHPTNLNMVRELIVQHRSVSEWGSEYSPSQFTMNIILLLFAIEAFLLLINILKNLKNRQYREALFALSLILFFTALGFDQTGDYVGWKLLLFRSLNISGAMLAYLVGSSEENKV
jgi:hypothetical protein